MPARGRPKGVSKGDGRGRQMSGFNKGIKEMTGLGKRADAKAKKDWADLVAELKARDERISPPKKGEIPDDVFNAALDDVVPEYEAERILDSKTVQSVLTYYVLWKGYRIEDATWEPIVNLTNSTELIDTFYQANPTKPGGPNAILRGRKAKA